MSPYRSVKYCEYPNQVPEPLDLEKLRKEAERLVVAENNYFGDDKSDFNSMYFWLVENCFCFFK